MQSKKRRERKGRLKNRWREIRDTLEISLSWLQIKMLLFINGHIHEIFICHYLYSIYLYLYLYRCMCFYLSIYLYSGNYKYRNTLSLHIHCLTKISNIFIKFWNILLCGIFRICFCTFLNNRFSVSKCKLTKMNKQSIAWKLYL